MSAIFLSASVPVLGRGGYYKSANPFLIQTAVREFMLAVLGRRELVWGGHPAITPMVWAVCEDLGVEYAKAVTLYQSMFFRDDFPAENRHFRNVRYIKAVRGNRDESLRKMRHAMLTHSIFSTAVFIGGMEGVLDEYEMLVARQPRAKVLPVPSAGGAALLLATRLGFPPETRWGDVDFARLFHEELGIHPDEPRHDNKLSSR